MMLFLLFTQAQTQALRLAQININTHLNTLNFKSMHISQNQPNYLERKFFFISQNLRDFVTVGFQLNSF